MLLIPLIPHGQIEHHTREQSTLSNPQRRPRGQIAGIVLDDTQEGGHDTPDQGEGGQPDARRGLFQHDVAGDFEDDVADEVEGEAGEVLISGWFLSASYKRNKCSEDILMWMSSVMPSRRALPTIQVSYNPFWQLAENIPLLRSKNDRRYRIVNAGSNRISSLRSNAFSLMLVCDSAATLLAAGDDVFLSASAMMSQ